MSDQPFDPEVGDIPTDDDVLSRFTEGALSQVLQANGLMLTGFIGLATFMNVDGDRYMRLLAGADANEIIALGMADKLQMMVREQSSRGG